MTQANYDSPFMVSPFKAAFAKLEGQEVRDDKPINPHEITVLDAAKLMHKHVYGVEYEVSGTGFHELLARTLDDFLAGKIKRLMLSAPPQHGKSQLIKYAIALALARNPRERAVYASYGAFLAEEASLEIRDLVFSDWFKAKFGVQAHKSRKTVDNWKTSMGGGLRPVGVGGGLTGRPADRIFIDDPHKDRAEANSDTVRTGVQKWFSSTLRTRMQGDRTGLCIVMTRWHEDDLMGWLQGIEAEAEPELKEGWVILKLPALAEEDDPLNREVGDPLYPEKFSKLYLLKAQSADPLDFEALYQGNPTIAKGDLFKLDDFMNNGYTSLSQVPLGMKFSSFDTAQTEKETSDFTAGITAVIDGNKEVWITDFFWERMQTPAIKPRIEKDYIKNQPDQVFIENKSSGIGVAQEFRVKNRLGVPVKACNPGKNDKVLRSVLTQGKVSAGQVHVPLWHPRLAAFLAFFTGFPNAKHDDPVDALTQLINNAIRPQKFKPRGSSSRRDI